MSSSIADLIAPQLPYVRRFGRALTGSQDRGDAYVVALLEALVADQSIYDRSLRPRTALYRAFLNVWNAMPMNQQTEQPEGIADRRIETLTPAPRQAFLLASVEEFPTEEIALILGKTEDEVRALVDSASREISQQISARVMIIEDEPLIAMDIETLVSEVGHEVVGIATTRTEAVALARQSSPGIILADIQLADGSSGIDAVADILREFNVPVVFITAYPERLLTGDRAEPAFLVTKPFKPEMVKAVISQALFFDVKAGTKQKRGAAA
ncbi:MAG: response regulator [Hyphomicrobium sp.]